MFCIETRDLKNYAPTYMMAYISSWRHDPLPLTVREKFSKKEPLEVLTTEVQRNEEKTMKKVNKHDKSRMKGFLSLSFIFATYKQASDVV